MAQLYLATEPCYLRVSHGERACTDSARIVCTVVVYAQSSSCLKTYVYNVLFSLEISFVSNKSTLIVRCFSRQIAGYQPYAQAYVLQ